MNKKAILSDINFYLITDSHLSKHGILSDVKNAIIEGCNIVQYREKNKDTKTMLQEALDIKHICGNDIIFLINDRLDIALAVDADGVHIGQNDMPIEFARKLLGPDKIIGLSTHNLDEAKEAEIKGADYVGIGPIFKTHTKEDAKKAIGIKAINQIKKSINIPVIAIGGIDKNNCVEIIKSGADGLVSISAVLSKNNVAAEIKDFINIIKKNKS